MFLTNFTFQDILGTLLAVCLFPFVLIFPGYVTAWFLNLLDFRQRSLLMKVGVALITSFMVSPVLIFLCWRLASGTFTLVVLLVFLILFMAVILRFNPIHYRFTLPKYSYLPLAIAVGWILLVIFSLVDIQFGGRLYYSIVSLDYTTRVAVTNAVSRTGVPPVNPSYYPGYPVKMTSLYYFWYLIVSVIDQIGLQYVDGRYAMIASAVWSGLALMAVVSIYLRLRTPGNDQKNWRMSAIGIGTLAVGGLDILPILILLFSSWFALGKFYFDGVIEHWNEQIATWLTSVIWDPHHVGSLIICMSSLMFFQVIMNRPRRDQIIATLIVGLGFASAFGLSVWTTLVFGVFWGLWCLYLTIFEKNFFISFLMMLSGVFALLAASPFILDLIRGLNPSDGFPLALTVRKFNFLLPVTQSLPVIWQNLIHFGILPINYLLELGYFFLICFIWIKHKGGKPFNNHLFSKAEMLLLGVTAILATFVKSTVIANNDFGWRAWLFGQFVLLVWSTDFITDTLGERQITSPWMIPKIIAEKRPLLALFLIIGLVTTTSNFIFLRTWPLVIDSGLTMPYELSQDSHLGERTFAARLTYEFITRKIPLDAVIQNNPASHFDRPLGLYGNRQVAISDITPYGAPLSETSLLARKIEPIFLSKNPLSWTRIDEICRQFHIAILVVSDRDPIWEARAALVLERPALYFNNFYDVLSCGNYSNPISFLP